MAYSDPARHNPRFHCEIGENPVWTAHLVFAVKNHSHLLRCWLAQHDSQRMIKEIQVSKPIGDMPV